MPAQAQHHVMSAYLSETAGAIAVGDILILDALGDYYVKATLANRTAAGRTIRVAGIALKPSDADDRSTEIQTVGPCPADVTGLGAGAAGAIYINDSGRLSRSSFPISAGVCDTDGQAYLNFASGTADTAAVAVADDIAKSAGVDINRVRGIRGVTITGSDGTPAGGVGSVPVYNAVGGTSYKLKKPTNDGWFNVRDYGAVGDGVTDDLAAFEATMAAARTSAGVSSTIFVPDGNYYLSDTLHITECLRLRGPGAALKFSAGGARLKFEPGVTGIWLHTFDSSAEFVPGGRTGSAQGAEIDHLLIEATAQLDPNDIPLWQPSTAYIVGNKVRSLNDTRFYYECVVAGTSGTVQPMRDAEYDTVGNSDGSDNTGKAWDATFDDPIDGSGTLEWRTRLAAGIHSLVQCKITDVDIAKFFNSGIAFTAYLNEPYYFSSTSNSFIENSHISQCGTGVYIFGGDAGVCRVANVIVESSGVGGPWETQARPITGATNASPIVITTNAKHLINTLKPVTISGVGGNTAANGTWSVVEVTPTTFSLTGSTGNGAYTSGGSANQITNDGIGFLDSAQYGSHWENCNAIGNTGRATFRPLTGFGTAVWTNFYIEGDQPNPEFNGLVSGGVWGVDYPSPSRHYGYNGLEGYWHFLRVKDFNFSGTPAILFDNFTEEPGLFNAKTITHPDTTYGEVALGERYENTGSNRGWWMTGYKNSSNLIDRPIIGWSTTNSDFGQGHFRNFRGELRGEGSAPYFFAYTATAKTDRLLRQIQGVGGKYLVGDRYLTAAAEERCTTAGWDTDRTWSTPLNVSPYTTTVNVGTPSITVKPTTPNSRMYACTKSGAVGGGEPTWITSYLGTGGIVPYMRLASTRYKVGDYVHPGTGRNGHYYMCTAVSSPDIEGFGYSSGGSPAFATGGGSTTTDGQITWTEQGSDVGTYVADGTTEWQCVGPTPVWTAAGTTSPGGSNGDVQYNNAGAFGGIALGAVGSVLRVTGATTSAFGALDLADSDARTGLLPVANIAAGSNTQVLTTTGGVTVWAAAPSGVPGSPSNGQFLGVVSSAAAWTNNANFYAAYSNASVSGTFRAANATTILTSRNAANSADVVLAAVDSANDYYLGMDAAAANKVNGIRSDATNFHYQSVGGSFYVVMQSSIVSLRQATEVGVTIGGSSGLTNPFRFTLATVTLTGGSTIALTAAQYACPIIVLDGNGHATLATRATFPTSTGAFFVVRCEMGTNPGATFGTSGGGSADLTIADDSSIICFCNGSNYRGAGNYP